MSAHETKSPDPTKDPNKAQAFLTSLRTWPPMAPLSTMASMTGIAFLFYGTLWGLTGVDALPGGPIFGLFGLALVCYLGGQFTKMIKLPTLVGMMVCGFILRNVPHISIANDIPKEWGSNIRHLALILILLRAGLEVDSGILLSRKATCSKLIFIPFIFELIAGSLAAHFLFDMPWMWAFVLGSMLSAVSPAVVLPVMLKLQKKGIGAGSGVPTMVIAVAGIDDVLALTVYEVLYGIQSNTGETGETMEWLIARGPIEVLVGIVYGIVLGVIIWYIPSQDERKTSVFRFLLLLFGGMFCLFGSQQIDWGAAGALGCICLPFVAGLRWKQQDFDEEDDPVGDALAFVWKIIEPFLFGLVGAEIKIEMLTPSVIGLSLATMFIALAFRIMASMLAAYTAGLNVKEQVFVTIAGLPKATVQAAIGPQAYSWADKHKMGPVILGYGTRILTVAVLAILIFAPLGAIAIAAVAERLLSNGNETSSEEKQSKSSLPVTVIPMYDQRKSSAYVTKIPNSEQNIRISNAEQNSYDIGIHNSEQNSSYSNSEPNSFENRNPNNEHGSNLYSSSSVSAENLKNLSDSEHLRKRGSIDNSNVYTSEKL